MADIKVSYIKRLVTTNTNYFFPKKWMNMLCKWLSIVHFIGEVGICRSATMLFILSSLIDNKKSSPLAGLG